MGSLSSKTQQISESKRIKDFRLKLAKQIPKFPNDRASLRVLEAKALGPLLIDYANWAIRYVAPRPRAVVPEDSATSDPRWQSLSSEIEVLLSKVKQGQDLTPHLSLMPHTRGFTPAASAGRLSGTGSPEGTVTAPVGWIYQRLDGSGNIYTKTNGTGTTGWHDLLTQTHG